MTDRYDAHHLSGAHLDQPMTEDEIRFTRMTAEQRRDYIDQLEYRAKREEHFEKEMRLQEQVRRQTEISLQGNQQLQAQRMGVQSSRVVSSQDTGVMLSPDIIDSTTVYYQGIEISGQQARDMVETGQWDQASYQKALNEALQRNGLLGSFR